MELIKITTNEQGLRVVSARELYEYLEVKKHFTQWFEQQKEWFTENVDYLAFNLKVRAGNGLSDKIDYAISLDMAKELAMMSKVAKGKEARQYFIECERKLQTKALPTTKELALMVVKAEEEKEQLAFELEIKTQDLALANEVIKEQAPAVAFVEKVLQSKTTMTTTQIAKELDLTADKLYSILRNKGVVFKQSGNYMLYGKYQGKGYAETRTHQYYGSTGESRTNTYLVWTESGRKFIHEQLNSNLNYAVVQTQTTAQWQG